MNKILVLLTALLLVFVNYPVWAQQKKPITADTLTYSIIKEQLAKLYTTRGVSQVDIMKVLKNFEAYKITSDQDLADLLKVLYPANSKIGFLLYFYHNNQLRRVFLEPGRVIEQKNITITEEALKNLNNNIRAAIGVNTLALNRAPWLRGTAVVNNQQVKSQNPEEVIKEATKLLIPAAFDEQYEQLVIIPAFNIGTFPFHLLKPYKDKSYLIDKCSFVITPGIIDFISLRIKLLKTFFQDDNTIISEIEKELQASKATHYKPGREWQDKLQNFDSLNFTYENPLFLSNPAYPVKTKYFVPDLPGAKLEIANTTQYAKTHTLLEGKEATKQQILKYLKTADLAYFATHGVAGEDMPMQNSFLVVSGEESPFLTAAEIMALRLKEPKSFPEMVILSACQTGLGQPMEYGVAGLARSFLIAGSNHVMMSLWNVDDAATAYLMNRFSFYLQQRHKFLPAGPLRLAILDTRKKYPNPAQWAGFSVFGISY